MGKTASLVCAIALAITCISYGDSGYSVCSSPPEVDGAVTPQFKASEHPIGTAVIYNCPPGYVSLNIFNQISLCKINTENGRAEWTVPKIMCNHGESGSLSTTEPAVTSVDRETQVNEIVDSSSHHTSDADRNEDCFCTYDYEDQSVEAKTEEKTLKVGDKIRRGERVSFKCKRTGMVLIWQNGLRLRFSVNMICNVCKKWQLNDVPTCKKFEKSEALISFYGHSNIYPGGIAIVQKGVENKFYCYNNRRYPEWDYGQRKDVSVIRNKEYRSFHISLLVIREEENELSGKYECYVKGDSGQRLGSTFLHLQADETNILCPPIDASGIFTLQYSDNRRINSTVTFYCKDCGKRIQGSSSLSCLPNGTWSGQNPKCVEVTCEEPQSPKHGTVKLHGDLKVGSLATYSCDSDRKLNGEPIIVCLISGQWTFDAPECSKIYCSVPADPVNGRVKYSSLEYGTELKYECNVGYIMKEYQPRICSGDGSWSNEDPECIEVTCEEPEPPKHGTVLLHGDLKVGSLATYSCDPDRRLFGETTIECLMTGHWNFDAPECLKFCKVPFIENGEMGRFEKRPKMGNHEFFQKILEGTNIDSSETLYLRCEEDNLPVVNSEFLHCDHVEVTCSDGTWLKDLQCKQTSCHEDPPFTKNAQPVISSRKHGSDIHYICNDISTIKIVGNVMCHLGSWIGPPPKCLVKPCYRNKIDYPGLLKPPEEYFDSFESFEVKCRAGYKKSATGQNVTCVEGRWEISQNPCIPDYISCPEFPHSPGLNITYSGDLSVGSIASFECSLKTQYLNGSLSSICHENGSWSNPLPLCVDQCSLHDLIMSIPEEVLPDTSNLKDLYVILGFEVKLECFDRYVITGDAKAVCEKQGKWKFGEFQCVLGCLLNLDPSSRLLVHPMKDIYRVGELISLSCPPGEEMSSEVERLMCLPGQWTDPFPNCKESSI